jgi:chitinase
MHRPAGLIMLLQKLSDIHFLFYSNVHKTMQRILFIILIVILVPSIAYEQQNKFAVIGYYAGKNAAQLDSFPIEKLTHIIFSFGHLKGNHLNVDDAIDSATIKKMVSLKSRNNSLKIILSLGGWGGCANCSDVFATKEGRKEFSKSTKQLCEYFGTDGIDLDWEYPAISGYPGHKFQPADKENFTALIKQLRKTLGNKYEVSFAAGGFGHYIEQAVEWKKVMKKVNYVNMMTYDLVSGFSKVTGHHTALYSTEKQVESTDNAIQKLFELNVPKSKIVIGAAFYGRMWESVPDSNSGLYQPGKFVKGISYKNISLQASADSGFVSYWDERANAPYLFNPSQHLFVTYEDKRSIQLKTKYAMEKKLGGIMFWQLREDAFTEGLLDAIDEARRN